MAVLTEVIKSLDVVERRDRMVNSSMNKIRPIIRRMELQTKGWVVAVYPTNYAGYVLPMQPLLQREIRDFYHKAYLAGALDVAKSVGRNVPYSRSSERARVKADLVFHKIVQDTENKLRLGWAMYYGRGQSERWLKYHTSKVFAELAERTIPDGL